MKKRIPMMPKALVVENNPVLQKAISVLLEKEGCEVVIADDGLQALDKMKLFVPDIIFTDLVMPLVDGAQLCKVVKNTKRLENIYIVVVSAIVFEEEKSIMEDAECDLYIAKGNLKELKSHLQVALEMYRKNIRKTEKVIGVPPDNSDHYSITSEILLETKHREEIVACLAEGVIELNNKGIIVEINQAALEILDYREEQVIGTKLSDFNWGEQLGEIERWIISELMAKGLSPLEFDDENPILLNQKVLKVTLLAISETNHFGLCIITDITRQHNAELYSKKLENSVRQLKKMEAMSGMAGGMAHDFNNMLTVICGNLDMLQISLGHSGTAYDNKFLGQAKDSAITAVELVKKISEFSPFGVIEREKTNMANVVQEAVTCFSSKNQVAITIEVGPGGNEVEIDKEQVITAIHNILQNSIDAKGGGNIQISVKGIDLTEPIVESGQYVPAGDYVALKIADNGNGIDPKNLTLIFDPYVTSKPRGNLKGMGLGLAIVYATVRNHGGYIVVYSTLGKGAEITIYLPRNDKSHLEKSVNWVRNKFDNNHVLLIDDDENSLRVGAVILEYLGFDVLAGDSELDISAVFKKCIETGESFAVALVSLPELNALDGVKVCRNIHQLDPGLKVVAMCSALTDPVVVDFKSFGFANILPKPYTIDDLNDLLSTI